MKRATQGAVAKAYEATKRACVRCGAKFHRNYPEHKVCRPGCSLRGVEPCTEQ